MTTWEQSNKKYQQNAKSKVQMDADGKFSSSGEL